MRFTATGRNGFRVTLTVESSISRTEEIILQKAVRHMAAMMGSVEFRNFCYNYRWEKNIYTGRLWWKKLWKTAVYHVFKNANGKNNTAVYDTLMKGAEMLQPTTDGEADIVLRVDRRNKKGVLGYTYPNTVKQWVYGWFLKSDFKRVAGNLAHEWCHKMGYGHAYRYNPTRKHTVPYAVGDYVAGITR